MLESKDALLSSVMIKLKDEKKLVKKFQHFSFGAQFMVIAYLVALLVISYNINALQDEVKEALADTQHTQKLANDLLQSSEDLTRMSRTYVSTGDPIYKHAFLKVLQIRNGLTPRPSNYSPVYWHLNLENGAHLEGAKSLPMASLRALMLDANFTAREISLLDESQHASDKLAEIEQKAFALIAASVNLQDFDASSPNAKQALALLYDKDYVQAKKNIMVPISQVIASVENRTSKKIATIQSNIDFHIRLLWISILAGAAGFMAVFLYTYNRFVTPLSQLSDYDALTGVFNRRGFMLMAKHELQRSQKDDLALCLLMIDIDHFKMVNDNYGHMVGDQVLKSITKKLHMNLRASDSLGRWGGEEFIVILPNQESSRALVIAERLRESIEQSELRINKNTTVKVTISIGLSCFNKHIANLEALISSADERLYKAKQGGRNQVCR
ncbi:GGDEF domain-containing protein [Vibrio sp. S4M6]|uniref:GGDEF domain-containing protein n=1 Tax=Vibrio sinus TaxID=2946865 RepID=UPI002029C014|nr:GGDEF domain-containing protein [Vibrio sinus]MCL9782532.1 GGDEF domain-containing protein [Vibrio sinus]